MIALTLADVASLCGGTLSPEADPATRITGAAVADSRRVTPGGLFVAVVGVHVDGHDFAARAVAGGAVAVLASRRVGVPAVLVDDTVLALGRLAHGYLDRLDATVVGVTGSSGKTYPIRIWARPGRRSYDRSRSRRVTSTPASSPVTLPCPVRLPSATSSLPT